MAFLVKGGDLGLAKKCFSRFLKQPLVVSAGWFFYKLHPLLGMTQLT